MRLNSLTFNENSSPDTITVTMTRREAQFIAKSLGDMVPAAANEVIPDGVEELEEIYDALVGDVFNRYWADGIEGSLRGDDYES